ncbi:MAG: molybdopterin-dependent oxidoreductase [Eggerthellaceae bacterium]|nr:molybdopterin-dependent oxidoreductase [Eggerthellaceae bacterium]
MSEQFETEWRKGTPDDYVVRTCAWSAPGCHPVGCGLKLHVVDGKLVDVEGDPDHPISQGRLCVRCLSLPEYIYHPDRIIYPMQRAKEDRGNPDAWKRISWDEALDYIEETTKRLQAEYGRETVVVFSGTGREATLYGVAMAYGVFRTPYHCMALSGQACYGPRSSVANFICGNIGYPEIDIAGNYPDRYDDPRYTLPEVVLVWGKDPLPSNPDGFFGHSIIDLMKRGTAMLMIDPRVTWLGSRCEKVLRIRPGTDAAIAMAMCNVIIEEELYDKDFVSRWVFGFDDFRARVAEMPPERAAEIAWCDADDIRYIARRFAGAHPASIAWGLAFDQQLAGGQAGHCVMALCAMTGNLDVPGGILCNASSVVTMNFLGKWRTATASNLEPGDLENRIGHEEFPVFTANMFSTQPDLILEDLENDGPVKFRMGVLQSSNLFTSTANVLPDRWYEAFKRFEFVLATDLFMNPTIQAAADMFLPVKTFVEQDAVVVPYYGSNLPYIGSINKAITVGECLDDIEINIAIGKRLNPEYWYYEDSKQFFDEQLREAFDLSLDEFKAMHIYHPPYTYKKYEKGMGRPDGYPGFNSPTGKIEFKSTLYKNWGYEPLPYYIECPYSPVPEAEYGQEVMEKYPLAMTTGARKYTSFHSEHRMIDSLRQIDPWPIVQVHPDDAAKYGVVDGGWATLENMFGRCNMKVQVTPTIHPGVVMAQHGWWFPEEDAAEPNLYGVWKSNVNVMLAHKLNNPMGYGSIHKNMCCSIRPASSLDEGLAGNVEPALHAQAMEANAGTEAFLAQRPDQHHAE